MPEPDAERLYEMRDCAAIREKADIALQIAHSAGDAEVEAKYQALNDPRMFWAYVAATRPAYTYEACAEYEGRRRQGILELQQEKKS